MPLILDVALRGLVAIAAVILFARLQGLRSFSKMSSFDFPLTVAFGSIIGGAMLAPDTDWRVGLVALALVFGVQWAIAWGRLRSRRVEAIIDNPPVLLMDGEKILSEGLARAQITEADLWAKLREANVLGPGQVRAVVMEATGDISVLHDASGTPDIARMIKGVRRA